MALLSCSTSLSGTTNSCQNSTESDNERILGLRRSAEDETLLQDLLKVRNFLPSSWIQFWHQFPDGSKMHSNVLQNGTFYQQIFVSFPHHHLQ